MRRSLVGILTLVVVAMIAVALWVSRSRLPEHSVLVLELEGDVEDEPPRDLLAQWNARGPALPTLLLLLDMAAADERVDGVLLDVRTLSVGYARLQELRDALAKVRASGKTVVAYLQVESLNATREIYLASAANKVVVDPAAMVPLGGIAGQYVFLAGMFEKIGVRWEYSRVGEYKSAVEQFAAREMSPKARAMSTGLIDGIYAQLVDGLANGRNLSGERVRALFEQSPATPQELVDAGLADAIADRKGALAAAGLEKAHEVDATSYQRVDPRTLGLRNGPEIALVFGDGAVVPERSRSFGKQFAADDVTKALDAAADDEQIRAVVLRINSPGGDAMASDQLWRAVKRVREKKPVVISMGDYAASGGYYVASAGNAILSQPATLTGSIGVFMLRPVFAGLYDKLAIGRELIARGGLAAASGGDGPLDPKQRARLDDLTRSAYQNFLARVADGRSSTAEAVDKLGGGRVYLGSEALAHNLVDELGGLSAAVARAKKEAKLEGGTDPARVILPAPRGPVEQLKALLQGEANERVLRSMLPFELPDMPELAWLSAEGTLAYLPPYWLEIR
jgi:protease-4